MWAILILLLNVFSFSLRTFLPCYFSYSIPAVDCTRDMGFPKTPHLPFQCTALILRLKPGGRSIPSTVCSPNCPRQPLPLQSVPLCQHTFSTQWKRLPGIWWHTVTYWKGLKCWSKCRKYKWFRQSPWDASISRTSGRSFTQRRNNSGIMMLNGIYFITLEIIQNCSLQQRHTLVPFIVKQ